MRPQCVLYEQEQPSPAKSRTNARVERTTSKYSKALSSDLDDESDRAEVESDGGDDTALPFEENR